MDPSHWGLVHVCKHLRLHYTVNPGFNWDGFAVQGVVCFHSEFAERSPSIPPWLWTGPNMDLSGAPFHFKSKFDNVRFRAELFRGPFAQVKQMQPSSLVGMRPFIHKLCPSASRIHHQSSLKPLNSSHRSDCCKTNDQVQNSVFIKTIQSHPRHKKDWKKLQLLMVTASGTWRTGLVRSFTRAKANWLVMVHPSAHSPWQSCVSFEYMKAISSGKKNVKWWDSWRGMKRAPAASYLRSTAGIMLPLRAAANGEKRDPFCRDAEGRREQTHFWQTIHNVSSTLCFPKMHPIFMLILMVRK